MCREDMLKRELADITRRGQAAEERHEELASALPEATRPLLRQIEAMQASAAANSQAWATVEYSLEERLNAAEARAAASGWLGIPGKCCARSSVACTHERPARTHLWLLVSLKSQCTHSVCSIQLQLLYR